MINFINSWAQGIMIALIIATIIEIIIPEGNNKKYVKTVIGIYILFSIISPIIKKIGSNIDFNSIINATSKEMNKYTMNEVAIETNSYIENTYKDKLKNEITKDLEKQKYKVTNIDMKIETQEEYGKVNLLIINLENLEEEKNINKIEEVNINLANKNETKLEIPEDKIKQIKSYLENTYGIDKERIYVNETV